MSSSQNPAKAPRKMGTPGSVLHDNVRPHSSKQTTQHWHPLWYTILPHPPHSPHLAPSDYVLFNKIIEPLHGRKFPTSDDMERGAYDYTGTVWKLPQRATEHRPWWGVCQKCYSVICHQSSAGGLWPSWVSILYEWPLYLIWWWFLCSPHLLCYKHKTVYRQSSCTTAQCSFTLTMTNFSDHRNNEHSMDSRLLCLHWQPLVRWPILGLMPRTGAPETGNWVSGHWSKYAYETCD